MAFQEFVIQPLELFEGVIHSAFSDLLPAGEGAYDGVLNEFTLMDNVANKRPIVDIRKKMKIIQRRDASCDLNYKKIMGTGVRSIEVTDLYGAVQHCKHEFYQGALRDWENEDGDMFGSKILPYFKDAMRTDLAANAWFGDVERVDSASYNFSTCEFNGVFKWLQTYTTNGLIPASQTIAMPVTNMRTNPSQAYGILLAMYNAQSPLMRALPDTSKAFYVSKPVLDGYKMYLRSLGTTIEYLDLFANGVKIATYEGIPIIVVPLFEPILVDLNGGALTHNAAILTMRKNFCFATDKDYGEGEDGKTALMVWYEKRKLSWYYQMFLKGGTQIAEPEMIVYAL